MRQRSFILISMVMLPGLYLFQACKNSSPVVATVVGKNIQIELDDKLHSRIVATFDHGTIPLGGFQPSEYVSVVGKNLMDFAYTSQKVRELNDEIGHGKQYVISGSNNSLEKEISVSIYEEFPAMAFFKVKYSNTGEAEVSITSWTNNQYAISAQSYGGDEPLFWSFQSGSYESRSDWVLPITPGFSQENYMGMNASDYGGGTPISDVWRKDIGIGVGHVELVPKLVSIPVSMPSDEEAILAVKRKIKKILKSGDSFATLKTFVIVHRGDYFQPLSEFSRFMRKQGFEMREIPKAAYEPIWCAWGYEREFTADQVMNTLPKVKELGFKWAVLDDGWQTAEGDWYLDPEKFPNGDEDMRKFVESIHNAGLKAKIWWAPMAVDPGTDLISQHEDFLLINSDGKPQDISWWDAYYLCPADPRVQEYTRNLVIKIMDDWGFDGLKIDGQHLNAAPPCFNKAHNHARPEESVEKVPELFKIIYETAMSINPQAVVEICPCGTASSFYNMAHMNQPVSSDPLNSWQIRLKGKTYKALMGPSAAYYGDHVELSDPGHPKGEDFASTVGVGGIVGTKFTWPVGARENPEFDLTPELNPHWKHWIETYLENMLCTGTYLGELYDIGFDEPETHTIWKDSNMYYAFYADSWVGDIEMRGLQDRQYHVVDYVNQKDFGIVTGPLPKLNVEFDQYLLLKATPQ